MQITYLEIRSVSELIKGRPELFSDTDAEAIAKMVVLAGRDTTTRKFGPGSQDPRSPENVLGLEKCPDCGKYLRHTCGKITQPSESPLRVLSEVPKVVIRPLGFRQINQIVAEGIQ